MSLSVLVLQGYPVKIQLRLQSIVLHSKLKTGATSPPGGQGALCLGQEGKPLLKDTAKCGGISQRHDVAPGMEGSGVWLELVWNSLQGPLRAQRDKENQVKSGERRRMKGRRGHSSGMSGRHLFSSST